MGLFRRIAGEREQAHEYTDLLDNLNNILNSKRNFSCYHEKYGISDFSHFSDREHIVDEVINEIRESIELYEPRVSIVEMSQVDENMPFRISFKMRCVIRETNHSIKMVFDSLWNNFSLDYLDD